MNFLREAIKQKMRRRLANRQLNTDKAIAQRNDSWDAWDPGAGVVQPALGRNGLPEFTAYPFSSRDSSSAESKAIRDMYGREL
jgi:hypothetical protein